MAERLSDHERQVLTKTILRIHEQGWGIAFGLIAGLGLFVATNILVFKGGHPIGPHLNLLRMYFPGYSVSFGGSFIGLVYGFVLGYGVGRLVATIYNGLTSKMR